MLYLARFWDDSDERKRSGCDRWSGICDEFRFSAVVDSNEGHWEVGKNRSGRMSYYVDTKRIQIRCEKIGKRGKMCEYAADSIDSYAFSQDEEEIENHDEMWEMEKDVKDRRESGAKI